MGSLSQTQRTLISITLMLLALIWISLTIRNSLDQLSTSFVSLKWSSIALSFVPAITMIFITAYIYFLILSRSVPVPSAQSVMKPFIASQVVRYLPGKIWGVFYQAQASSRWIPTRYTLKANIEHYILVNLNSIAVFISVFIYYREGIITALGVFAVCLILVFLVLKRPLPFLHNRGDSKDLLILGLLQAEWLFYFIACVFILPSDYDIKSAMIISTSYAMAWLVGALAILLPSGLFVREASFIWITGLFGFNPVDMLIFSIVARTLFTLADIVSAFLSKILLQTYDGVEMHEG